MCSVHVLISESCEDRKTGRRRSHIIILLRESTQSSLIDDLLSLQSSEGQLLEEADINGYDVVSERDKGTHKTDNYKSEIYCTEVHHEAKRQIIIISCSNMK